MSELQDIHSQLQKQVRFVREKKTKIEMLKDILNTIYK